MEHLAIFQRQIPSPPLSGTVSKSWAWYFSPPRSPVIEHPQLLLKLLGAADVIHLKMRFHGVKNSIHSYRKPVPWAGRSKLEKLPGLPRKTGCALFLFVVFLHRFFWLKKIASSFYLFSLLSCRKLTRSISRNLKNSITCRLHAAALYVNRRGN